MFGRQATVASVVQQEDPRMPSQLFRAKCALLGHQLRGVLRFNGICSTIANPKAHTSMRSKLLPICTAFVFGKIHAPRP